MYRGFPVIAAITVDNEGALLSSFQQNPSSPVSMPDGKTMVAIGGLQSHVSEQHQIVVTPVVSDDGTRRMGTLMLAWSLAGFSAASRLEILQEISTRRLPCGA